MLLTLYDQYGNEKAELQANDSSTQDKEVQADNVLSLGFTLYAHVAIDVNDYVDFGGERYWAVEKYEPAEKSSVEWEYSLKLYGIESLIKRFLVLNNTDGENEAVFTLTARPVDHVRLIVKCINEGMGTTDFKVGSVEGTDNVVINYEGKYCDEALKELAETVGVEWWFDGETLNLSRCEWGSAVVLGYGEGLTSLEQDKADNVKFYTRLYPIGSSRNIDRERYGASRLQLPGGAKYVDMGDLVQKYGVIHHYEQEAFSGIYPRRVGVVSSVRSREVQDSDGKPYTIYYFKDNGLTFDPNAYEIGGLVKHVSFQEGSELAGLGTDNDHYFEVNFDSETREFEIITIWPYDDDRQLPGDTLVPKPGDKYILWNIRMPDEYYTLAEAEFQSAVEEYNRKHTQDVSRYKAPTDHVWIEDTGTELEVGRRVRLKSQEYFPRLGYRESRITRISRSVNLPSQMDLEISDALSSGTLDKIDDSISDAKSYAGSILGAVNVPDIIKSWEDTKPTDNNLFSARKSEREFLSKRTADTAQKKITFKEGADFGEFHEGAMGALGTGGAVTIDENGNSIAEFDFLTIRKAATFRSITILELKHIGGELGITAGAMKVSRVEEMDDAYRCYFDTTDGKRQVYQEFVVGDQARCQAFRLSQAGDGMLTTKYYWRLVVGVGDDYVDLSKNVADTGSGIPEEGDEVIQLGYRGDDHPERQSAIILSAVASDAPSQKFYQGIDSFNLADRFVKDEGYDASTGLFHCNIYGSFYVGDSQQTAFMKFNPAHDDVPAQVEIKGKVEMSSASTLNGNNLANTIGGLINGVTAARTVAETAQAKADTAGSRLDALSTGNENLVVNGGFTGLYESDSVDGNTTVGTDTEIFSDPFGRWSTHSGCEIVTAVASATGMACQMSSGTLTQTISRGIKSGQPYTLSVLGIASGTITVKFDNTTIGTLTLTAGQRSSLKVIPGVNAATLTLTGLGTLSEILLIQGNVTINDWTPSPEDNNKFLSYYKNFAYLMQAIDNASTTFLGGLVLTQAIRVGNYANKVMTQETGGMNGDDAGADQPFLWGGGSLTQALNTITAYANDPTIEPDPEDLADMAKFVVTHGGRAILTDVIARGMIIATSGIFKNISSPNGNFYIDENGNMVVRNSAIIGGLVLNGKSLTNQNGNTFDDDAQIIFRNDPQNVFAGMGTRTLPLSLGGTQALLRLENYKANGYSLVSPTNYGMMVGARNTLYNIAIALTGGCISRLALRTKEYGWDYVTNATEEDFRATIPDDVCDVFATTEYYWRSSDSGTYQKKNRNVYLTLPDMKFYDDGHVVKIKRGFSDSGEFHVIPGASEYLDNGTVMTTGSTLILCEHCGDNPDDICYATNDNSKDYRLYNEGRGCELVYHRDMSMTINGKTYHGIWIEHKFPRDW